MHRGDFKTPWNHYGAVLGGVSRASRHQWPTTPLKAAHQLAAHQLLSSTPATPLASPELTAPPPKLAPGSA